MGHQQPISEDRLYRIQLHLRRTGMLVERIIALSKQGVADGAQASLCAEALVTLVCQIGRYREELDPVAPYGVLPNPASVHLADLMALRQCALHWLGQREGKALTVGDALCDAFEAQAWPTLASGVTCFLALQLGEAGNTLPSDLMAIAHWWGNTVPLTMPAALSAVLGSEPPTRKAA